MCNNFSSCHKGEILNEDNNAIWVYCTECGYSQRIGKDIKGNPEHRAYGEFMKRDFVQPDHPLYFRYAGAKGMRIV